MATSAAASSRLQPLAELRERVEEPALDRAERQPEHVGDLLVRQLAAVAQGDHGAQLLAELVERALDLAVALAIEQRGVRGRRNRIVAKLDRRRGEPLVMRALRAARHPRLIERNAIEERR